MRAVDIIIKVRDHEELTTKEIEFFVTGSLTGVYRITRYPPGRWQYC